MKSILKALGVLAGVAAAAWLIRDRLVTVTVAREPAPPTFRVAEPSPDDLTLIRGIGPAFAERLRAAGVTTFAGLAAARPAAVAEAVGVSEERAQDWIGQAAARR